MNLRTIKLFFLIFFLYYNISVAQNSEINIIPEPFKIEQQEGQFIITPQTKIVADKYIETSRLGKRLSTLLKESTGHILPIERSITPGEKSITLTNHIEKGNLGKEGYELDITANEISIKANTTAGLFYGIQTLRQLIPVNAASGKPVSIHAVHIEDMPRFGWRGMHLDVSRHFYSKEFVKKYIDLLALHKINVFHWHLTDDQGWRIEVKKYPKLTEVGAWRVDRRDQPFGLSDTQQKALGAPKNPAPYGGFYTQEDVKEVVKYAQDRFITILPEIEMPAHSAAALAAYPQYSCTGKSFPVPPLLNIDDNIYGLNGAYCAGNDSVFIFLQNVLSEIMPLFPNTYFHIGGDEVEKTRWRACPKCQKRMRDEGLHNEDELQSYFIKRIEKFVVANNKKLIGWDEILEGGLAPQATVMSWRGVKGGVEAAKENHDVIMAPSTFVYLDYPQNNYSAELGAWTDSLPLKKIYLYEPIPEELSPEERKHILGAEAALWTEQIQTPERVEYMALPRLCAMSEVIWSPKEARNFEKFTKKMNSFYPFLDKLKYNYYVPLPSGLDGEKIFFNSGLVALTNSFPNSEIRYTIDGTEPGKQSMLYKNPIVINKNTTIKAKTFMNKTNKASITVEGKYKKEALNKSMTVSDLKPGIAYKYSEGNYKSVNDIINATPLKTGIMDKIDIPKENSKDGFGVEYYGYIKVPADGVYTFFTKSDDGTEIFIGEKKVVTNDGVHGDGKEVNGQIVLQAGLHPIKVLYFEGNYGESIKISYEGPDLPKQEINTFFYK